MLTDLRSNRTLYRAIDEFIQNMHILNWHQKEIFRECYLQQKTVESTACRLSLDPMIVRMLYYKLSILLSQKAFLEVQN